MKKLLWIFFVCLPLVMVAQDNKNFSIKGKIEGLPETVTVLLSYYFKPSATAIDTVIVDSTQVKNGRFSFVGKAPAEPARAVLSLRRRQVVKGNGDQLIFYIEGGNISISAKAEAIALAQVAGSPTNDQYAILQVEKNKADSVFWKQDEKMKSASEADRNSAAFKLENNAVHRHIAQMRWEYSQKFIKNYPFSFLCIDLLQRAYGKNYEQLDALYGLLTPSVRQTPSGQQFAERLVNLKATRVGSIAPEISMPDTSGNIVELSSFRGRYVLIDFWASWCKPCREENPNLVKNYHQFKDRNFTVLGISLDQKGGKERWMKAIKDDGLEWTHVSDLNFWNCQAVRDYAVNGVPANFLIDPQGKIIAVELKGEQLGHILEELLPKK